uniref:Ribosomal RNA processing 7 homolog A n=1 Tax=Bos mutus grunniens TaxID=30521 RepID=A0A8B9XHC8_BOSMU
MVARRRKRAVRESDSGVPTLPGYSAIPIKFSEKQQSSHYLYVREHKVREGTKSPWPPKRTLFVLNVPPYCTEECLLRLLSPCGPVQSVELQEKPELAESPKEPPSKFFHPKPVPARPDLCGLGVLSAERPPPGFATSESLPVRLFPSSWEWGSSETSLLPARGASLSTPAAGFPPRKSILP